MSARLGMTTEQGQAAMRDVVAVMARMFHHDTGVAVSEVLPKTFDERARRHALAWIDKHCLPASLCHTARGSDRFLRALYEGLRLTALGRTEVSTYD